MASEYRTVEILREFGQDSKQPHALLDLKPGRDPIEVAHSRAESLRKARRSAKREDARSKFREVNL